MSNNAAGAFANRSSWYEADPNKSEAFAYPVGRERQSHIEDALRSLGRHGPASVRGLVDYDGKLKDVYSDNWEGRYLVTLNDGSADEAIVCHAKPFINPESYRLSDEVYKHVRTAGLLAPELLPFADGELVQRMDDIYVSFTTFVPGNPVDPDKGHMWDAGHGIAVFKNVMAALPDTLVAAIAANGQSITHRIERGIDYMLSPAGQNDIAARFSRQEALNVSEIAHIFREETAKGVAPCHGDLVPGNYYINDDGTSIFLDFDNVGGSMFPRDVDIGTVLHRIGFEKSNDSSIGTLKNIFTDVLDGYNDIGADRNDEMTPKRLILSMKTAIGWKLCGAFGELAMGQTSYQGAESKIRNFSSKAFGIFQLAPALDTI